MERNMHAYELPPLGIRVFYEAHGNILSQRALPEVYYNHKHTYFELHVMEYGCVSFEVGGQTLKLCGGDFCLVYPGTVHVPAREQAEVVRGSLGFEMTDAKGKMSELLLHKCQQGDYFCGRSETLAADWHRLREETVSSGPLGEEMVSALLSQLLICMIRTMQSVAEVPAEEKNTLDQLRTVYIDTFLNNRFFLPAGESVLAEELGVSRRQLDRIFQKLYGKSYRERLMEVRAEAACDLLKEDIPIREIADRVGYGSSSNFAAFFKKYYGVTPSQYRQLIWEKL